MEDAGAIKVEDARVALAPGMFSTVVFLLRLEEQPLEDVDGAASKPANAVPAGGIFESAVHVSTPTEIFNVPIRAKVVGVDTEERLGNGVKLRPDGKP